MSLDYSSKNIDTFTWKENYKDIISLDLSFNNLKTFSWKNCTCKKLKKINLNCNILMSFSFKNCPETLEEIYLQDNFINHLKGNFPKKLKILDFSKNKIQKIPMEYFVNCNNLKILKLKNNKITEWTWEPKYLRKLQQFNIFNNKLVNFSWYNSPKSLKYVDLSFNRLFDFSFVNCPYLEILYIQDINLRIDTFIWDYIPNTLKEIDLNGNYITNFTWKNCECKNLKTIFLVKSHIKSFTWNGCPKKLKFLNIKENEFKFNFKNCPDIETLIIDEIKEFEDSPDSLNKLIVKKCNLDYDDLNIPRNLQRIICGSICINLFQKNCFNYIKHQSKKLRTITDSINHINLVYSDIPVLKKYACKEYYKVKDYFEKI